MQTYYKARAHTHVQQRDLADKYHREVTGEIKEVCLAAMKLIEACESLGKEWGRLELVVCESLVWL